MAPRRLGNTLGLAFLVCLHERPMYPYEAAKLLRQSGKDESLPINYGSLYSAVASLATKGLIAPRYVTRQGRQPPRTVYVLTEQGRNATREWLAEILRDPSNRSSLFQAALSLMAVLPADDATRLLQQRARRLELDVAAVETQVNRAKEHHVPRLFRLGVEYRQVLLAAEVGWTQELIANLATRTQEQRSADA
jgi:DNA-binding PadR family transcriptional regulator